MIMNVVFIAIIESEAMGMKIDAAFFQNNPALRNLRNSSQTNISKSEASKKLEQAVTDKNSKANEDALSPELQDKLNALSRNAETKFGSEGSKELMRMLRLHLGNLENADQGRAQIIEDYNEICRKDQEVVDNYQAMLDGKEPLAFFRPALSREAYEQQGPHMQITHTADGKEIMTDIDYDSYKTMWDAEQTVYARKDISETLTLLKDRIKNKRPDMLKENLAFYDFGLKKSREIVESIVGRLTGQAVDGNNKFDGAFWKKFTDHLAGEAEKGNMEKDSIESIFYNLEKMTDEEKNNQKAYEEAKAAAAEWLSKFDQPPYDARA